MRSSSSRAARWSWPAPRTFPATPSRAAPAAGAYGKDGEGAGSGIFLGGNGSLILAPGAGQTQTISGAIVDQTGAGGTGTNAGSWSLVKDAAGTTVLTGTNAYTGGTTVNSGILQGTRYEPAGQHPQQRRRRLRPDRRRHLCRQHVGHRRAHQERYRYGHAHGTNTYSGGTTINGGLVNFSSGSNFGTGAITLNGGGLQWASGNTLDISSRLAALGASGGTFDTNGNNVTLDLAAIGGTWPTGQVRQRRADPVRDQYLLGRHDGHRRHSALHLATPIWAPPAQGSR